MDAFYFSVVVIVSLLCLCGRCEAYLVDKDTDEKIMILAIVFMVVLVMLLIVLVIVMRCFVSRCHTSNSLEYKNATTLKMKEARPYASDSHGKKKESAYLPDYETVGPAAYENPGVNARASRIELAEEPNQYEHVDLGKNQPTSFSNDGYEATTGTYTFQTTPEPTKEKECCGSNTATIENQTTSDTLTIKTTSETNIERESSGYHNMNGGIEMATTSYTLQTTPAQAAGKESSDPYTALTTPSSANYYESLSSTASSHTYYNTAL